MAKHQVVVRIINAAGPRDLGSELESQFLNAMLALFHVQEYKSGSKSRAEVECIRASSPQTFYNALMRPGPDVFHIIGHGSAGGFEVGLNAIRLTDLATQLTGNTALNGAAVVTTACELGGNDWVNFFLDSQGAECLIASPYTVSWRDVAVFSSSFYNAYLGQIHRGGSEFDRAWISYRIAWAAYRSFISNKPERTNFKFYTRNALVGPAKLAPIAG